MICHQCEAECRVSEVYEVNHFTSLAPVAPPDCGCMATMVPAIERIYSCSNGHRWTVQGAP